MADTNQWRPPFVSNTPVADALSALAYHQLVDRALEQQRQSEQGLSCAKLDVERYQRAIEFSQKRLAKLALTLVDPTISAHDRQFATSDQATQLKFLQESQENLKYAQQGSNELQGTAGVRNASQRPVTPDRRISIFSSSESFILEPIVQPDGSISRAR